MEPDGGRSRQAILQLGLAGAVRNSQRWDHMRLVPAVHARPFLSVVLVATAQLNLAL